MAYEVAQEGVRQAIGYHARPIGAEEAAAEPNAAAARRAEQQAWAALGQELTPLDTRVVKRIRRDADALLIIDDEEDDDEEEEEDDDLDEDDEDEDGTLGQS